MNRPGLSFSHVGFFVHRMAPMEDFYRRQLGFTVTDRGQLPSAHGPRDLVFLSRDPDEHHQIVLISGRPEQVPFNVINQVSLRADNLTTLRSIERRLRASGASDIQPVTHGNALSVYAPDPEGNRLEIFIDLPWYVQQPLRVAVDLTQDDETLWATLEAHARGLPGFQSRSVWRDALARRMAQEDADAVGAPDR